MTKLEQVERLDVSDNDYGTGQLEVRDDGELIYRDQALAAATIDLSEAEQRGYRQGVEDGKSILKLHLAERDLHDAIEQAHHRNYGLARTSMIRFKARMLGAFHGARGIDRVEIRQRLERLKEGNGNG